MRNLQSLINHQAQTVTSATGEVKLDYGKGALIINSASAQGVSGLLHALGKVETRDLWISSDMELGHIVAVSLDQQPLERSHKILLQVMSEEKTTEYKTEPSGEGVKRITSIGRNPWQVRELNGKVSFKRADAGKLKVVALDFNGYPIETVGGAADISLQAKTLYYLVSM